MTTELTLYKLTVLYMLHHSDGSMTNSQIMDFILSDEQTNYFRLQQSLSELTDAGLIGQKTVSNTSYYSITEDGSTTLSYFEEDLPQDTRDAVLEYLKKTDRSNRRKMLSPADYYQTDQGTYNVRCQILDNKTTLLDFSMMVPNKETARAICLNWPLKSQEVYEKLMDELL